jgi:hypothetical protein
MISTVWSTYGTDVTFIVENVVCKTVDTVVRAVTEDVAVRVVRAVVVVSSDKVVKASTLDQVMISIVV